MIHKHDGKWVLTADGDDGKIYARSNHHKGILMYWRRMKITIDRNGDADKTQPPVYSQAGKNALHRLNKLKRAAVEGNKEHLGLV